MVDSHETLDMHPNLSALLNVPLNDEQHFRLKKSVKLKIILLLRLMKQN